MKSVKSILICILLIVVLLTGCTTETNINDDIMEAENFIKFFSSREFNGRLVGTKENDRAAQWISDRFNTVGLEPYFNDSFLHSYIQEIYLPENQKHELVATFKDGKVKKYTYGEDFLEQNNVEVNIMQSPLVVDVYSSNAKDSILLLEDLSPLSDYYNKNGEPPKFKCILVKNEKFRKNILVNEKGLPIIQISEGLYDDLINDPQCKIDVISEYQKVEREVHNVVGKIPGKNNNEAIVLSAHFDHVGSAGDKVFQGALDNTSGLWVLLKLAEELQSFSESNSIDRDIVICAFNGEEANRKGSQAFVETIHNDYNSIVNINIDTLGEKGDKNLCIIGDSHVSGGLIDAAYNFLKDRNYDCIIKENELTSDHISFSDKHLPSINIGQLDTENIHTKLDTYDNIDYDFLRAIKETVLDFVKTYVKDQQYSTINHSECTFENEELEIIDEELSEEELMIIETMRKESEALPFNKYKVIMINENPYVVTKDYMKFKDIESVKAFYKDINIPETYNGYKLDSIIVSDYSTPTIDINKLEINKEYERPMKIENIYSIDLRYTKNEGTKSVGFKIGVIRGKRDIILDNDLSKMSIEINGETYEIICDENSKRIWNIRKTVSNYNDIYTVTIGRGNIITIPKNETSQMEVISSDLSIENIEEVKTFIKSINVNNWIDILKTSE